MNEDFIPFELSKNLKEKGFTCEMPFAMYNELGEFYLLVTSAPYRVSSGGYKYREYYDYNDFDEYDCVAPTISQVLKWLREVKNIHIGFGTESRNSGLYFGDNQWRTCSVYRSNPN